MKKYIVITNAHPDILVREVNEKINEGWKLAGGISVAYKHEHTPNLNGHLIYAQALELGE